MTDALVLIALFALWFGLGIAFGWKARDARDRRSIKPVPSTPNEYVTVPVYVVHWHREDELYVATVDGIDNASTDVDVLADLDDAIHDLVYSLTGSDRFWLEWKPGLPSFS